MAWRRLGAVAMKVTAASLAAATAQAREVESQAPPMAPPAKERPVLFSRAAVVGGPAESRPSIEAVSAAA